MLSDDLGALQSGGTCKMIHKAPTFLTLQVLLKSWVLAVK